MKTEGQLALRGRNGQGPKREESKKNDKRDGERRKQKKQRQRGDGKRLGKEGTGKQRKRKEGEKRKGGGGGGRQISYLRENPQGAGPQKTPRPGHSSLLLPLTTPSPSACPARLRWFPCGRFIFKNADAVPPRPALTLWPQGPQPSPGTPPSRGEGRRGERRPAAPGQRETPALGSGGPQGPRGQGRGSKAPAHSDGSGVPGGQELDTWLSFTTASVSFSCCVGSSENWGEGPGSRF